MLTVLHITFGYAVSTASPLFCRSENPLLSHLNRFYAFSVLCFKFVRSNAKERVLSFLLTVGRFNSDCVV